MPFVSDDDLEAALQKTNADTEAANAALNAYRDARIGGLRSALAVLSLIAIVALFLTQRIPTSQPRSPPPTGATAPS